MQMSGIKEINCAYPDAPDYSSVVHQDTKVGSIATYSCHHGYELKGDDEHECQYDGTWSGKEPQCETGKLVEVESCE